MTPFERRRRCKDKRARSRGPIDVLPCHYLDDDDDTECPLEGNEKLFWSSGGGPFEGLSIDGGQFL